MALNKPYIRKPLIHSPRDEAFLASTKYYLIRTPTGEVKVSAPEQCVAALRAAKRVNMRCMVYAVGEAYGEDGLVFVDEEFLLKAIQIKGG